MRDNALASSARHAGVTARTRIFGWLLLLVAVALAANLLIFIGVGVSQPDGASVTDRAEMSQSLRDLGIASLVALVGAGVVSWLVAGRLSEPIRSVRWTAESISATDLASRIEVRGNDDAAAPARTFNHMLDRLEIPVPTRATHPSHGQARSQTPVSSEAAR